jgi:6-phosphogluconolactonase
VTDRPAPVVEVYDDAGALSAAIATRLLERLEDVQATGRIPQIGLTGGAIADEMHRELARLAGDSSVDWSRVEVWWGDERYVPADSPDRNALQARSALLDALPLDPARVHEMPSAESGDLEAAAASYGDEVRASGSGAFDVVMLGVGPDGHVASLFPGSPQLDVDDRIAVAVTDSPKPPPERISLTFAALNRTEAVWFLVSGGGKADAVAAALAGADKHDIPATGVTGMSETLWLIDEAAGAGGISPVSR